MGVYNGGLFVPDFPAFLPKLCMLVTVITSFAKPIRSLKIRILKNEDLLLEHLVEEQALIVERPSLPPNVNVSVTPNNEISMFSMPLVISPFMLDAPMIIRVRAEADEDLLRSPGLIVRKTETA